MGNPQGVYEIIYKVKKAKKKFIWENMASFRPALSREILLHHSYQLKIRYPTKDLLQVCVSFSLKCYEMVKIYLNNAA